MFMDFGFFFLLVRFVDKTNTRITHWIFVLVFFFSCNSDKYHNQRKGFTLAFSCSLSLSEARAGIPGRSFNQKSQKNAALAYVQLPAWGRHCPCPKDLMLMIRKYSIDMPTYQSDGLSSSIEVLPRHVTVTAKVSHHKLSKHMEGL